jgi:hypothetical protein
MPYMLCSLVSTLASGWLVKVVKVAGASEAILLRDRIGRPVRQLLPAQAVRRLDTRNMTGVLQMLYSNTCCHDCAYSMGLRFR